MVSLQYPGYLAQMDDWMIPLEAINLLFVLFFSLHTTLTLGCDKVVLLSMYNSDLFHG